MAIDTQAIKVLILDDSQNNAERLVSVLRNAGHATRAHRITSVEDLNESLQQNWDLCLACPETSFMTAQEACMIISQSYDVPFIMLSPDDSCELRTEALRAGMQDVVKADSDALLVLVVKRELTNLQARRQRRIAERSLKETEKRCQLLLDSSVDAIAYVLDGMHIYANRSYTQLFGYEDPDDLAAEPMLELIAPKDQDSFKEFLRTYAAKGEYGETRCTAVSADGQEFPAMLSFSPANYDGEPCTQVVIRPETASAEFEEKLKAMASHDLVTGLFNRSWFQEQLDRVSQQAVNSSQPSTLVYISIDAFSALQADIGIGGSDLVLADFAQILRQHFPEDALLARFGDDACSVLLEGCEPEAVTAQLPALLKRIESNLFEANGRTVRITASIGVSSISETNHEPTQAIERAHRLAEQVSQAGGNALKVFNPLEELEQMANRGNIIAQIRHALETDAFRLEFQPIISLRGDSAEHYEVFLRLLNSQGEEIAPLEFQSAALESGLAMEVDRWLISRGVNLLSQHRSKGSDTRLLLSLSSASLQDPEIVKWISELLKESRLPGDALIFQFNDADANNYLKHAKVLAESLRSLHARISLSHFGGALNPYAVLKHLPVDYVKIDESFSRDLSDPAVVEQLKEMVATLHNQGKLTIVSNVDSAIMMPTLWQAGVNYIQGNYLQPPSESMNFNFSQE